MIVASPADAPSIVGLDWSANTDTASLEETALTVRLSPLASENTSESETVRVAPIWQRYGLSSRIHQKSQVQFFRMLMSANDRKSEMTCSTSPTITRPPNRLLIEGVQKNGGLNER